MSSCDPYFQLHVSWDTDSPSNKRINVNNNLCVLKNSFPADVKQIITNDKNEKF